MVAICVSIFVSSQNHGESWTAADAFAKMSFAKSNAREREHTCPVPHAVMCLPLNDHLRAWPGSVGAARSEGESNEHTALGFHKQAFALIAPFCGGHSGSSSQF